MKMISWNMGHRTEAWRYLLGSDADIALLQEAHEPPADIKSKLTVDEAPWRSEATDGTRWWRSAVVQLNPNLKVKWLHDLPVSRPGTLAAAEVVTEDGRSYTVASMYGLWEKPHPRSESSWIYADASVHRVISDLAALIGREKGHRILAAGDLNILFGYGEGGNPYWSARYATVFARMEAMGMPFIGPQAPGGRAASPWPSELPEGSKNVPTYYTTSMTPGEAARQLDFVFASRDLSSALKVHALNDPDSWGPSDHCQIAIDIEERSAGSDGHA